MDGNERIRKADLSALSIVKYGAPQLTAPSVAVGQIDEPVRQLADRMFEVMFQAHGVGLAAPQVGINVLLFVASPSFEPTDRRVYVNPRIVAVDGWQEEEEGCLSVPGVTGRIKRRNIVTIQATDLEGRSFQETGEGLTARVFQHEMDHLEGVLLVDRMGSVAKLACRRTLKELEERHSNAQS